MFSQVQFNVADDLYQILETINRLLGVLTVDLVDEYAIVSYAGLLNLLLFD